jgi:hypothetical protein
MYLLFQYRKVPGHLGLDRLLNLQTGVAPLLPSFNDPHDGSLPDPGLLGFFGTAL